MAARNRRLPETVEFGPILLANALPIAGVIRYDLTHTIAILLYLFELFALFVVYCGCALFARRKTVAEGREGNALVFGNDDGRLSDLPSIPLPGPLPAVYVRNLRVIVPTFCFVAFFFVTIGETYIGDHEAHDSFPSWLSAFASPPVFWSALGIVASHVGYAYRSYFRPRRYEDLSAATLLEFPVRMVMTLVPAVIVLFLAFVAVGGVALTVAGQSVADRVAVATLLGGFFLIKTAVEWARFRAERSADSGGLAGWFVPSELRSSADE